MPKIAKELSPLAIKNLKHSGKLCKGQLYPEKYPVGGVSGLLIQVQPHSNSKYWLLRTTIAEKRKLIGIGPYPEISLKDAREHAAAIKQKIRSGTDPIAQRKAEKAALAAESLRGFTFSEVMNEYLENKLQDKSEKSRRQWRSTLCTYADPVLGAILVDDIDVHDVLRVLEPIWKTKTETASRVRQRIESVLTYATVKGFRRSSDNPARWTGHLKEILPMPNKVAKTTHMPAVQIKDAPLWFAKLQEREGMATRALEFLILTAARSGEVRGAVWDEMDMENKLWIIPADRMKMKREHRVPLSDQAMKIIENIPRFEGSEYVFPAVKGGALSDMSLSACMRRIHNAEVDAARSGFVDRQSGKPAVPHGLRSTFRDWAGEKTEYPREIVELCLAHDLAGSVERAYRRGDILEKRRKIMSDWAGFLRGE